ncbi:MAG: hypothetical protein AAFQ24_09805 [Pseudomonadota bacterium]
MPDRIEYGTQNVLIDVFDRPLSDLWNDVGFVRLIETDEFGREFPLVDFMKCVDEDEEHLSRLKLLMEAKQPPEYFTTIPVVERVIFNRPLVRGAQRYVKDYEQQRPINQLRNGLGYAG